MLLNIPFTRAKSYMIENIKINNSIQTVLRIFENYAIIQCVEITNKTV